MKKGKSGLPGNDGHKVNAATIPVPELCAICKRYYGENAKEAYLCNLNRLDQRYDDEFKCHRFVRL